MMLDTTRDLPLWSDFEEAARRHRRDPAGLLNDYMRECLETWEAQALDVEIREDLREGPSEDEAEEIVRQYRREKAAGNAAA